MKTKKILIVEDEAIIAMGLKFRLEELGYHVLRVASMGKTAIQIALQEKPDLIFMDISLKGSMDGIEAARKISQVENIPLVYLSGNSHLKNDMRLITTNPIDVISKPVFDRKLLEVLEKVFVNECSLIK